MTTPPLQWTSPVPMWSAFDDANRPGIDQPTILRFDTDYYMEELLSVMKHEPHRLPEWEAQPETWRVPAVTPPAVEPLPQFAQILLKSRLAEVQAAANASLNVKAVPDDDPDAPQSLKLYQPAQMRHYIVTADLLCRVQGLPHKRFNVPNGERPSFVIRRLLPKPEQDVDENFQFNTATCDEYAYVQTPRGRQWRLLETPELVSEAEERLPMFIMPYQECAKRCRRVLGGVIPVGRREQYTNTPLVTDDTVSPYVSPDSTIPNLPDKRLVLFQMLVTEPWRSLIESKNKTLHELQIDPYPFPDLGLDPPNSIPQDHLDHLQDRVQMQSWYILLDLKDFLQRYMKGIFTAIETNSSDGLKTEAERELYARLSDTSIAGALRDLDADAINSLETAMRMYSTDEPDSWESFPDFSCFLANPDPDAESPSIIENLVIRPGNYNPVLEDTWPVLEQLVSEVFDAILQDAPARTPDIAEGVKAALERRPQVPGWFVIRCVFERPNCVPYKLELLSRPTVPFQMASYYDPEAPSRPIRIAMPEDTTLNGLRKHQKNTLFMLSDMLCGQVEKARSLSFMDLVLSVLPWPFHRGLPGDEAKPCGEDLGSRFGMILSLSIPIITVAGLLMLIIIVSLLDQIFRWLPYFITLIPVFNSEGD